MYERHRSRKNVEDTARRCGSRAWVDYITLVDNKQVSLVEE